MVFSRAIELCQYDFDATFLSCWICTQIIWSVGQIKYIYNGGVTASYLVLFLLFDGCDYNLYLHPVVHTQEAYVAFVLRTIIGITGALTILFIIQKLSNRFSNNCLTQLLAKIGSMTLGIYCIQVILAEGALKIFAGRVELMLSQLPNQFLRVLVYDWMLTPFLAVLVVCFCYFAIYAIRKNKSAKLLLLGEN